MTFDPGSQVDYPKVAKVTTIKDILDPTIFEIADNESRNLHEHGEYFRNSKGWGDHLVKTSTPVMITNVMNDEINQHIKDKVQQYFT